jgi:uncharacterized protein involved in exopolysaccharide biosynthesis
MYPASSNSISKTLLTERQSSEQDILEYGEEAATEQMLQLLNSSRIRNRVVRKFDLMAHYDIAPGDKYRYTKLQEVYEKNIRFSRTEYMAVKISVMDTDPALAAKIANEIAQVLDSVKNEVSSQRAVKAYQIVKKEYEQLQQDIRVMEDSLTELRKLGVHDYESQAEMFNQQLAMEIARENSAGVNALERKLNTLAKYASAYIGLSQQIEYDREKLSLLKRKYEESKVDAFEVLPQKFIVEQAYKSEKKAYPVRWLIVVITVLGVLFMTSLLLLIARNFNEVTKYMKKPN